MSVTPEQRSTGNGGSPRLPKILVGLAAALALTAAIVFASDPSVDELATTTTSLPIAAESTSTTATSSTSSSTTVVDAPTRTPVGDYVAELNGELVTLQGQGNMLLITRSADDPEVTITPVPGGSGMTLDSTGESIGLTVPSSEGADHLYLGDATELVDTRLSVTSYAWHHTRPGQVAAITVNSGDQSWNLNTFRFDPRTKRIRDQRHIARFDVPKRIRAWTDSGFILSGSITGDPPVVEFIDSDSQMSWQDTGVLLGVSVAGDILVSESSGESQELRLLDPDGSSEVLDWTPVEFNATRWSTSGEMVAFIGYGGENSTDWGLTVYTRDGALINSQEIPWRVWDVQWGSDERFVLMPGTDNQGTHAVIFYDRHTGTLSAVDDYQDWVQWSDLRP